MPHHPEKYGGLLNTPACNAPITVDKLWQDEGMGIITSIFSKLAASLSLSLLRATYRKLSEVPAFNKAAGITEKQFPGFELSNCFKTWFESEEFAELFSQAKSGKSTIVDKALAKSFSEVGGFYAGDNTEAEAITILTVFFKQLDNEILKSSEGMPTMAGRIETLHEEGIEKITELVRPVSEKISNVESILASLKASDKSISPEQVEEKIYFARVTEAKRLLDAGKCRTALSLLRILRDELKSKDPSKSLLFRIATNIGVASLQVDDVETAIKELEFAYNLEPDNPMAISNASAIALQKRDAKRALALATLAREKDSRNSISTANYAHALLASGKELEFNQLIESEDWIKSDSNCCLTIGVYFFEKHRYPDAEKYFRNALENKSRNPQIFVFLAHCLVRPLEASTTDPILPWRLPEQMLARLAEARDLLNQAISSLAETENNKLLAYAHTLRADVMRMQGLDEQTIVDCDVAASLYPTDETPTQIKALTLLQLNRFEESTACFEGIKSDVLRKRMVIPFAIAYLHSNKARKVVELLKPSLDLNAGSENTIKVADLLVAAYEILGETESAEKVLADLRSKWPAHPETFVAFAHHYQTKGKNKEAIDSLSEALGYSTAINRDSIALELADAYYQNNLFAKAADLYGTLANLKINNVVTRRYLACLFNTGEHKEALGISQALRGNGEPISFVSHIEARILAQNGDVKSAQELLERLAEQFPTNHQYKIEAAEVAGQRAKHLDAQRLVSAIVFDDIKERGELLIRVAQMRLMLKMPDILKFAYQARRVAFSSPDIHGAYVALFLKLDKDSSSFKCETVENDTSVILQTPDGIVSYTILDEPKYIDRGEISLTQAKELTLLAAC